MYNEPAFPTLEQNGDYDGRYWNTVAGLTKREWFAGMVLQGMLAHPTTPGTTQLLVISCFQVADAMIEQSQKPLPQTTER